MPVVDVLITEYKLKDSYTSAAKAIKSATAGMSQSLDSTGGSFLSLGNVASGAFTVLTTGFAMAGAAAIAAGGAIGAFLKHASDSASEMERAERAMSLYAGSSEELARQLKVVREVAKAPGLGLIEAMQGVVKLQAAGLTFNTSAAALQAFGNAIAAAGGSKEDLDGVSLALTQIATKGQVMGQEIRQLQERVPQIRAAMLKVYGTADTEELQRRGVSSFEFISKMVMELQKLPRMGDTFSNAIENIGDAANVAFAKIGKAVNDNLKPQLNSVSNFLQYLEKSGVFDKIGQTFASMLGGEGGDGLVRVVSYLVATIELIPYMMKAAVMVGQDWFNQMVSMYNMMVAITRILPGVPDMEYMATSKNGLQGMGVLGDVVNWIGNRGNSLYEQFKNSSAAGGDTQGLIQPDQGNGPTGAAQPRLAIDYLARIARNTKESVDLQKMALGFNAGKYGVSAVELSGMSGRGSVNKLMEALSEIFGRNNAQLVYDQQRGATHRIGFG